MSLIARYLEENGIPTVIIGSAQDIVEQCSVPRYLHVDFPLGNPCGKPYDRAMQNRIVKHGLTLLANAKGANAYEVSDEVWGSDGWRDNYMRVDDDNRALLAQMGDELRSRRKTRVPRDFS